MSVLEGIFNGENFLTNIDFRSQREYRSLSGKMDNAEQKFLRQLTEEQVEEYEKISGFKSNLAIMENEIVFRAAVSYAIQFMGEVYNSDSLYF